MNNSEDGSRIDNVTSDEILGILNHSTLFDAIILNPCALPGEKSKKSADEFRQQYQEAMSKVKDAVLKLRLDITITVANHDIRKVCRSVEVSLLGVAVTTGTIDLSLAKNPYIEAIRCEARLRLRMRINVECATGFAEFLKFLRASKNTTVSVNNLVASRFEAVGRIICSCIYDSGPNQRQRNIRLTLISEFLSRKSGSKVVILNQESADETLLPPKPQKQEQAKKIIDLEELRRYARSKPPQHIFIEITPGNLLLFRKALKNDHLRPGDPCPCIPKEEKDGVALYHQGTLRLALIKNNKVLSGLGIFTNLPGMGEMEPWLGMDDEEEPNAAT